jgi:hypothetical protein
MRRGHMGRRCFLTAKLRAVCRPPRAVRATCVPFVPLACHSCQFLTQANGTRNLSRCLGGSQPAV